MPRQPPTKTLTVFLGREGLAQPDDFIATDARQTATAYPLRPGLGFTGTLYIPPTRRAIPGWVDFVNAGLTERLPRLTASGVSAALVIKHEGRLFSFTFGHGGRSLLAADSYELDFGLKVVLNRVDVRQLRSIDTKNFEDIVISTRKQTSRSSELGAFGLDISRDLVRGVVGDPTDKTYFKRIAGSDAAVFATTLEFADLGDICEELLNAYSSTEYRKNFVWVDRVKQVRDSALATALDDTLVTALRDGKMGTMHLAPADIVEWERIVDFSFGGSGKRQVCTYPELTLEGYLDTLGADKQAELDLGALRRHQVRIQYADLPDPVDAFSVYECLVWDTKLQNRRFALMDGRWFEIEAKFAQEVIDLAESLSKPGAYLIPAQPGQREEDYNLAVHAALPELALMDQKLIRTASMPSEVECCDLLSPQREFIHIKKRGASATLSHLFSQGSVAAELFMQEQDFREKVRDRLQQEGFPDHAALIPTPRPASNEFKVVYGIIASHAADGTPPPLPFFSAVNLMQHHRRLQRIGVPAILRYIPLH
jgi:uncharacterized protein (TIGR04141 family)